LCLQFGFPPPIKLPRYKWNIVESGLKHHNPNPNSLIWKYKGNTILDLFR
jgi:hypothetical protein